MKKTELILFGLTIAFVCFILGYFTGQNSVKGEFRVNARLEAASSAPASEKPSASSVPVEKSPAAETVYVQQNTASSPAPSSAVRTPSPEPAQSPPAASRAPGALLNINTAGAEELMELPGIGEVLAGRIIEYRKQNGSFKKTEDIMLVDGIGEKTYGKIKNMIKVG